MLSAKKSNRQKEPRVPALPVEIKGLITISEQNPDRQMPFLVWDVSASGLGILLSDRLESGEILHLSFGEPFGITVVCSVVWCELQDADYDFQEPSFRVGLIAVDKNRPLQPIVDCLNRSNEKSVK